MTFTSYTVEAKIFVEEISYKKSAKYLTTGRLIELTGWTNFTVKTADTLNGKFGSINFPNPHDILATSQHDPTRSILGQTLEKAAAQTYAKEIYQKYSEEITFYNSDRNQDSIFDNEFFTNQFCFGAINNDANIYNPQSGLMDYMQRVYVVIRTDRLGSDKKERFTVWQGIIKGFNQGFDANGESNISVELQGLSRYLELTQAHLTTYAGQLSSTITDEISRNILQPILRNVGATSQSIISSLNLFGIMAYGTWLSNLFFTKIGYMNEYSDLDNIKKITDGHDVDPEKTDTGLTNFFHYEPIWKISRPKAMPKMPTNYNDRVYGWGNFMANVFLQTPGVIVKRLSEYGDETNSILQNVHNLWDNPKDGYVADFLPSVYVDDILIYMLDEKATFLALEKRLVSSIELFSVETSTILEIFNKIAQAILITVREDDFGNIILEIPKYWEVPYNNENKVLIEKYKQFFSEITVPAIKRDNNREKNEDYIMTGALIKSISRSGDESNIVTNVETTGKYSYIDSGSEQFQAIANMGRTYINKPAIMSGTDFKINSMTVEQLKYFQAKFGVRTYSAPTLYTGNVNKEYGNDYTTELRKGLNAYADSLFQLKNYSNKAATFNTLFLHWLDLNRNIFYPERGELWMLITKTLTYSLSGDLSCSFTGGFCHQLAEPVGWAYIDAYIESKALNDSGIVNVVQAAQKAKEQRAKQTATPLLDRKYNKDDAYNEQIEEYATKFNVRKELVKAIMFAESRFDPNAIPPASADSTAQGLMQLTDGAWKDANAYAIQQGVAGQVYAKAANWNVPKINIMLGTAYLAIVIRDTWPNIYFGITAYNQGFRKVMDSVVVDTRIQGGLQNLSFNDQVAAVKNSTLSQEGKMYGSSVQKYYEKSGKLLKEYYIG